MLFSFHKWEFWSHWLLFKLERNLREVILLNRISVPLELRSWFSKLKQLMFKSILKMGLGLQDRITASETCCLSTTLQLNHSIWLEHV